MKIPGRMILLPLIISFIAGVALGQTEPVPEESGQVENEVGVTSSTPTRSPHNTPFGIRAGYTSWKGVNQGHVGAHV